MKTIKHIIVLLALSMLPVMGQDSFLSNISVSPYGAIKHVGITKGDVYGAGIDVGLSINPYVSVHVLNTAYQTDDWRTQAIDETSLLAKATLLSTENKNLSLYGIAGGDRSWQTDDWAFGVGLGVEVKLTKNVSLGIDSRIRAWFNDQEDMQTRGLLNISF